MFKNVFKNIDVITCILVFSLVVIGVLGIFSAGYNTEINKTEYIKHIIFFVFMVIISICILLFDYNIFDIFGYGIYIFSAFLLVLVLFTSTRMGASSWFKIGSFLYQPSELMKVGYIICVSKVLTKYNSNNNLSKKDIITRNVYIAILFMIPFSLIMLQPDFGTAASFIVITFFILFASGLKYRYIFIMLGAILLLAPLVYMFILSPYQQERIKVFLDPSLDPLGAGYNSIQSKIAVGSGMLFGTGFLKGTQTQYGYLPIKSSDFIFPVLSEEFGFVMSLVIVILFTLLITRLIKLAYMQRDNFGKYIIIGVAGMIFFHFAQNVGMSIGLLPITGVPLPFVSYGGSSLMTNMIAIAICLNIVSRNRNNIF